MRRNILYRRAYVEGFRRASCGRCQFAVEALGEAIRVDIAGGGFQILHVCLACFRRHGPMPEARPPEMIVGRRAA